MSAVFPWIMLVGALELAWFPSGAISSFAETEPDIYLCDLGVTLDADVRIGGQRVYGFIGGSMLVPLSVYECEFGLLGATGLPSSLSSTLRAGLVFGIVEVGFEHVCTHPVVLFGWRPDSYYVEGGTEKVYVRVSSRGRE